MLSIRSPAFLHLIQGEGKVGVKVYATAVVTGNASLHGDNPAYNFVPYHAWCALRRACGVDPTCVLYVDDVQILPAGVAEKIVIMHNPKQQLAALLGGSDQVGPHIVFILKKFLINPLVRISHFIRSFTGFQQL